MAKKIEIGLRLEGQDATDFINHMLHPIYTKDAYECMKEALRTSERRKKQID